MKKNLLLFTFIISCNLLFAHENPFRFIENKGQWQRQVRAKAELGGASVFLEQNAFTFVFYESDKVADFHFKKVSSERIKFHAYKAKFLNSNALAETKLHEKANYYYNYFLGNKTKNWASDVKIYSEYEIQNLYQGINLKAYFHEESFKYDFIIQPKANPKQIEINYEGIDKIKITKEGNLFLQTSINQIIESKPYVFQIINGKKIEIPCNYQLKNKTVSFNFPKSYNRNHELIIDPNLVFSTFSGSVADNWGFTATNDEFGNGYSGGNVFGVAYPTILGAYDTTFNGLIDILIAKFDASGQNLLYYTYLGGNGRDQPMSLVTDGNENLLVLSQSNSPNYPYSLSAFDTVQNGGYDIVISKLSPNGQNLLASTYVGGLAFDGFNGFNGTNIYNFENTLNYNYGDFVRSEIIVDPSNNVFVASSSKSPDFPTDTINAYQPRNAGAQDAVVFKMDSELENMLWSTYLGGSGEDAAYSLVSDEAGGVYVTGGTQSMDFPKTMGSHQPVYQDSIDAFIAHLDSTGSNLLHGTFVGTTAYDQAYFIQKDRSNNIYIIGQTEGYFPIFPATAHHDTAGKQFICKYDSTLTNQLLSTVYGTGRQKGADISLTAFLIDECEERIFISGWGGNVNQTPSSGNPNVGFTTGLETSPNALQRTTDGSDFYLMVLERNADSLLYATFMGGNLSDEHVDGGTSRFDRRGIIYQSVCAGCGGNSDFRTSPTAYSRLNRSTNCNMLIFKFDFQLSGVNADFNWNINDPCPPYQIPFQNLTNRDSSRSSYQWMCSNGQSSTAVNPSFTFNQPGTYQVQLIALDTNTFCTPIDTVIKTIFIPPPPKPDFDFTFPSNNCVPTSIKMQNLSQNNSFFSSYEWKTSDGQNSNQNEPTFTFQQAGTYQIQMIANTICGYQDTIIKNIEVSDSLVAANFIWKNPDNLCLPLELEIINRSSKDSATRFSWYVEDNLTSTQFEPILTFTNPGKYEIMLIAHNDSSCNKADTSIRNITIPEKIPSIYADFCRCQSNGKNIILTAPNFRSNPVWFKESDSLFAGRIFETENPGLYLLKALDSLGCPIQDSFLVVHQNCFDEIPNVFTPNNDGINDTFQPLSADVTKFELLIYDRWGVKVFESKNANVTVWDGKNLKNNILVKQGVYYYLLKGRFCNGEEIETKGIIRVIR